MSVNLSAIDLNLFLVLHAVLEERSATRAAARLHVTQSAVSNALARLRQLLGDPLVVRSGRGLVPTPRAEQLAPLLREATDRLAQAVDRRGFVAAESTRTFTIALADSHQACDVPRIARAS
jgi:DNA-binding transcriptional LysR family regulator